MATTRDANNFFEEDDEETLRDLVEGDSEVSSRLETFAKRFLVDNDHKDASSPWSALVDAVNGLGFHLDEAIHAGPSLTESSGPLPAAFESEDGKKHLAATAALLNVSEKRAVKLTMSSLRSLDEASITNLQALLGTRSLVKKVMEYYFKQRVARVAIITECLRKEQDPDTADHSTIVQALDTLDATYTNERNHRGLFRFLLSIFGQKIDSYAFSRGQQHIKELRRDTPISLQESFAQFSPEEADRRRFLADCQELNKRRNFQEQTEAMEALIVLLYNRIQGGVGRTDLMMMLIAFHSTNTINESPEEERLSQLTGIIYTECMGLWRVFDGDSADGVDWVVGHPLLRGIIPSREDSSTSSILVAAAEKELEALMKVLLKHVDVVGNKKVVSESVGLLSFGILSLLAYNAILASPQGSDENGYWQVLGTKGEELVRIGSDKQALDCFRSTMESLVSSPARKADSEDNLSYDWLSLLADTRTSPMAICEGQDIPEMDANSLTYASIGNELLNGMTMALQDTILHVEHDYACQNIAMVCEMAACIYRNSPSLCEPFWIDWSEFTSATRPPKRLLPMCRVVDSAYLLVSNALQVDLKGPGLSKQQLLATLAPLLRLISSISYNADSVEAAFGVIPTSLLQKALLICAAENQPDDSSYHDQKWSVLYSISMLTRVGDSDSCRTMIRDALSGEGNTSVGPRILLRALSKAKESSQDAILDILADLMKGAPVKWVLAFEQALKMPGLLKVIEEKPVGLPLARLFKAFSLTTRVLFSHVCNDTDGENLLAFIWRGVLKLSRVVPLSMSNVSREKVPLTTLRAVFSFFATLLKNITPIMVLHKSVKVQSVARGIRDALIEMLSSSLGEVVLFYALLPISSSIGESLETYSQERSIIQCASMAEDDLSKNKYGMWHMAATRKIEAVAEDSTDASHVKVLVTNANIDFEGACQIAGYSEDELLGVAGRALSLLQLWARHVDDMLLSDGVSLDFEKKSKLMSISPSKYLTENAIAPHSIRGKDQILSLWDCAHPSNLQLLARYLDIEDGDSASWPLEMKALALDFMCACVDHVKRASPQEQGVGDTAIFKVLKKYTEVVGKYTERALDVITDDEADGNHMKKGAKTLGLLAKRFLCSVAETGAFLSADDNPNITQLITRFSKEIREVSDELYQAREARGAVFLEDDPLLQKLQSATGSLSFFNALWAYETSSSVPSSREGSHSMKKYIDEERGTVSKLSQVVLQHARLSEGDGAKGKNEGRCILFAFLTNAVDFLRLGTQICSDNTTENFSISLLKFWEEDAFEFLCMPRQFCSVDAPIDVAEAIKGLPLSELGARTVISNPFALLQVFPLLASSQNALPGCFCLDTTSAANLVDGLTSQRYSLDDINVKVFGLTVSRHLLSSQLALLRSWAEFSCVLLPLTSKRERASASFSGTPTDALSEPRRSLLQSAYHSLEVLQENLRNNETSCVDGVDLSCCEVGKMADQMAGMVLQVVVKGMEDTVSSPDMLVDLLQLVSLCAVKLFGMLQSNADECCTVQQQLLATSIGILDIVESVGTSFSGAQPKISHDTVSNLVMATSQVLRLMETPAAIRTDVKHKSLQTCIVLLSVLTAKSLDAAPFFGEKGLFRSVLSKRFDDLELLPMLVRQGHLYSSTFETQRTHAANPSVATRDAEENTVGVVVSVFDIILTISQQADFLAQLNLSGAFQMLLGRNPLFSRSGGLYDRSRKMRGYVPTQEKVWPRSPSGVNAAFFAGKDDPGSYG